MRRRGVVGRFDEVLLLFWLAPTLEGRTRGTEGVALIVRHFDAFSCSQSTREKVNNREKPQTFESNTQFANIVNDDSTEHRTKRECG